MILKNHYKQEWQAELEGMFANEYGIDIKLKIKEMTPLNLSRYGFDEEETYRINYADSIASTEISSYRTILDNTNSAIEMALINSPFKELSIVEYFKSFGESYIYVDNNLYRFNNVYWEIITSKYLYGLIKALYVRLNQVIDEHWDTQHGNASTIEKLRTDMKKKTWILRKQSFCKSIVECIKADHAEIINPFDKNIFLYGFTNGVYDLTANAFRRARKDDYVSMVVPFDYEVSSDEDIEYVKEYLKKIMPVEDERELLLLLLSTCLSGYSLDRFIVCTGLGSNGKDALFSYLLSAALGPYYYRANNSVLTQKATSELNVGIANMNKKRAVLFSETDDKYSINVALVKELTGANEINARGLYSSDTKVHLHSTMFMLCNDKPLLSKVDEAIARRLITIQFRSLFKSQEFFDARAKDTSALLDKCDEDEYIYLGDESIKSDAFKQKYRMPFINLLLPYFKKYKDNGFVITNIPESIAQQSRKYMEQSDPFYNWFCSAYKKTDQLYNNEGGEQIPNIIKLKDVHEKFKISEQYFNLTKQEKKTLNYKSIIEYVEKSPLLRVDYKRMKMINGERFKNILIKYVDRQETNGNDSDDE